MIKIIRGAYGFIDENGAVSPKTAKDDAFSASEDEEARLVNLGVAEYVNGKPRKEAKPSEDDIDEIAEDNPDGIPEDNPDEEESKAKKKAAAKRR